MEADWEIEIGGEAPLIHADWEGRVDLREDPGGAASLTETAQVPALSEALMRLNARSSPVSTTKCDVWEPEQFDPDEMNAASGEGDCAIACYIDVLPEGTMWISTEETIEVCKRVCAQLRSFAIRCCRTDLVIRRAVYTQPADQRSRDLGVTVYFTACGATPAAALLALSQALEVFADSAVLFSLPASGPSKLQ